MLKTQQEMFPKTVLWKQKRRWGGWKKWAVVVSNVFELKMTMDKIESLGTEGKFIGLEN